jgi:hypothetical protein
VAVANGERAMMAIANVRIFGDIIEYSRRRMYSMYEYDGQVMDIR